MGLDWDSVVGILIIVSLVLIIWARVTKQTVKEVILEIKDIFSGGTEEVLEVGSEVVEYD